MRELARMVEPADTGDLKSPSLLGSAGSSPAPGILLALLLAGCHHGVADRQPGERAPLTASCNDLDPTSCLLPWPSSPFTVADDATETGLRVHVVADSLLVPDRVDYLNRADGFSRVTGVATAFSGSVDADAIAWDPTASLDPEAPLQVFVAEPGHAQYGERMPFHVELRDASDLSGERWLLVGRPAVVLPANAEHVAVVLDTIGQTAAPHAVKVALGLVEADNDKERRLYAYHAPTRALLAEQGIDPARVVRVWDFTTRSAGDATFRLHAMMDALAQSADSLGIEIDSVVVPVDPAVAEIVRGRLTGAPGFLDDGGYLVLDDAGRPKIVGTTDIEFRVMVPAGSGDYRVALYGHGTGGDVSDPAFDHELGESGVAKVSIRFTGWTGNDLVQTLFGFTTFLEGSERSTAGLMQSLAGGTVLLTSLDGLLGQTLTADQIDGRPNPAAGRHPITSDVAWVGGSMGGTMGGVMVSADPRLRIAVLNVPGAGWTHMVPYSLLYEAGLGSMLEETYGNALDLHLAMVMGQGSWDEIDGAPWAQEALDAGGVFLLQESIGDPVLPNHGTELLANAFGAEQLAPVLVPIAGLQTSDVPVTHGAALEQYKVPDTGAYDVHGFAARDTPAGEAARQQIKAFLDSAWAGAPVMAHPSGCADVTPDGSCDFSSMWSE
jgi:hypothetical protein